MNLRDYLFVLCSRHIITVQINDYEEFNLCRFYDDL